MKTTKSLREKFALSQAQMAEYLSTTRSRLSLYEIGKRDLPVHALVKLSEMEVFLHNSSQRKSISPHVKLHEEKTTELLEYLLIEQRYQAALAKRKLVAIKEVYAQKLLMLDLLDYFRTRDDNASAGQRYTDWMNEIEVLSLKAIDDNGLHIQRMLQLKISSIQYLHQQAVQLKQSL
ncbi:MAG: hypothetical protein JWP81_4200 [Ferruginibacter sp.]|nr:hypothetical protein [Ferruginibacter sp.]